MDLGRITHGGRASKGGVGDRKDNRRRSFTTIHFLSGPGGEVSLGCRGLPLRVTCITTFCDATPDKSVYLDISLPRE